MKKCECGCGQELTGRQRKWASEACRKKVARVNKKRVRFQRQTSGFRPRSVSGLVEMRIIIDSKQEYPHLDWDDMMLQIAVRNVLGSNRVAYLVATELEHKIPGWTFEVFITRRG